MTYTYKITTSIQREFLQWCLDNLILIQSHRNGDVMRDVVFHNQYLIEDAEYFNGLRQAYMGQFLKSRKL